MKRLRLFCVASLLFCSAAFAKEPMFRGNPGHSGVYPGPAISQFTGVKWQFHTNAQVLSSPAIADGTLYVGSSDHNLYALDAATGTLKWKFKSNGRITSSPAVSSGVVYFASFDSNFYAVDAATGQLKWKFKTNGERRYTATHLHGAEPAAESMPDPFDFYLSSPVVENGVVYFGSGDTNIYALDATAGSLKWKFKTGDVVHASPAIANNTLFVGSWDSYFYALDTTTGKEKWRFKTGEDPQIHNQVGIQSSAAVADGIVYFGCRDSKFYAVDATTGKQLWAFPNKGSWVISSPAIAGDTLYIGSHEGKLLAIDLKSQKISWNYQTEASKQNGPTYTKPDGTPNYEAAFVDFFYDDMVSGVQKMMAVGAVLASPVIATSTIYIASTDGNIYALQ